MPSWAIILIAFAAVLIVFYLMGGVFYALGRGKEKTVYAELDRLSSFEEKRGQYLISILDELDRHGYNFGNEAEDLIREGSADFKKLSIEKKSKYKNTVELSAFLLVKIYAEDKRYGIYIAQEQAGELKMFPSKGDEEYKAYNRKSIGFNALCGMLSVKAFGALIRKKLISAPTF